MEIWMTAKFRLLEEMNKKLKILKEENVGGLCVGGFSFVIGGKEVPFDWDSFACSECDGEFTYESGYGFLINDPEISDCYDEDLAEIGLTRDDLTPTFLASASEISDFHINYWEEGEEGEELEVDLGDNSDPDMPIKIQLLEIFFEDEEGNTCKVDESALKKFNGSLHSVVHIREGEEEFLMPLNAKDYCPETDGPDFHQYMEIKKKKEEDEAK